MDSWWAGMADMRQGAMASTSRPGRVPARDDHDTGRDILSGCLVETAGADPTALYGSGSPLSTIHADRPGRTGGPADQSLQVQSWSGIVAPVPVLPIV